MRVFNILDTGFNEIVGRRRYYILFKYGLLKKGHFNYLKAILIFFCLLI